MRTPPTAKICCLPALLVAAGCAEEIPPRSVQQFLDDPIQLEAAVVRCAENRSESRYDPECMNARQAVSIIEAEEERARREAWEKQSERKREALRRTQEAAAEARRRAAEAERLREEAEYLAQFGEAPPTQGAETGNSATPGDENAPGAVIPAPEVDTSPVPVIGDALPASDGGNAPSAGAPIDDLDAVREELRRRSGDETQ